MRGHEGHAAGWLPLAIVAGCLPLAIVMCTGSAATPEKFRGRVTSVDYFVGVGVPQLGNFEAGIVASLTSPTIVATSGGLATVAGALVLGLAIPAFARYDAPAGPAASGNGGS
jgi:hypothetical protein